MVRRHAVTALMGLIPCALAGQTVRGTVVVDDAVASPVEGAFVTLVPPSGESVDSDLTDAEGHFRLRAAGPGRYRVRVDRIGLESWTSDAWTLAAGETRTERLAVPIRPVRLADLDVSIYRQCVEDPRDADQVGAVWEEARKALQTARFAIERDLYRFRSLVYDRSVSIRHGDILDVDARSAAGRGRTPFTSASAEDLSRDGYIRRESELSAYYYAPDADVLLSDRFMADHCFGLDRSYDRGRALIGLTFEPRDGRDMPDIRGVMWLDEKRAELSRLEFDYENSPFPGVDDPSLGGYVAFRRLPGGVFVVSDWRIRMPRLTHDPGSRLYGVLNFAETGGELREVRSAADSIVEWLEPVVVRGTIHDSVTGGPLVSATVTLDPSRGPERITHTDSEGEFLFQGLFPGEYEIAYMHPALAAVDRRPEARRVVAEMGDRLLVDFATPSAATLVEEVCGDRRATGAVVGLVHDEATHLPLAGIRISGEWVTDTGRDDLHRARTDRDGRFHMCDVPAGARVILRLEAPDGRRVATSAGPVDPLSFVEVAFGREP